MLLTLSDGSRNGVISPSCNQTKTYYILFRKQLANVAAYEKSCHHWHSVVRGDQICDPHTNIHEYGRAANPERRKCLGICFDVKNVICLSCAHYTQAARFSDFHLAWNLTWDTNKKLMTDTEKKQKNERKTHKQQCMNVQAPSSGSGDHNLMIGPNVGSLEINFKSCRVVVFR